MLVKVTEVEHYTERLFRFKTERPATFKFSAGEFTMVGIENLEQVIPKRAYSITSGPYDDFLEFLSIKVQGGPLTSILQNIKIGDEVYVGDKPTGTLTLANLELGGNLWLLATGTGIAPYISLLRDPSLFESFKNINVVWTTRQVAEQACFKEFISKTACNFYASTTRESSELEGRVQFLIENKLILHNASPSNDKIMICGSLDFNNEMKQYFNGKGWEEGNKKTAGTFVQERAFVS
jgi:ferredoxin--NADP+ reductase